VVRVAGIIARIIVIVARTAVRDLPLGGGKYKLALGYTQAAESRSRQLFEAAGLSLKLVLPHDFTSWCDLPGQLRAGLSAGAVQSGRVVSA